MHVRNTCMSKMYAYLKYICMSEMYACIFRKTTKSGLQIFLVCRYCFISHYLQETSCAGVSF